MAWKTVYDHIRTDIENGRLKPGQQLPTHDALAQKFGESRHAVRKALRKLEERGLTFAQQGRGCFVAPSRMTHVLSELPQLRQDAQAQQQVVATETLAIWRKRCTGIAGTLLGLDRRHEMVVGERLARLNQTPFQITRHYFRADRFDAIERHFDRQVGLAETLSECGVTAMLRVKTRVSARQPSAFERIVLDIPQSQPVVEVLYCWADGARVPIVVTESVTRADRITLEM